MLSVEKYTELLDEFKRLMQPFNEPCDFDSKALAIWLAAETTKALTNLQDTTPLSLFAASQILGDYLLADPDKDLVIWAKNDRLQAQLIDDVSPVVESQSTPKSPSKLADAVLGLTRNLK